MAASFSVVSQRRTVQVLSATEVLDVQEVGFVTHPSGVEALREIPLQAWQDGGAAEWIQPLAQGIEDRISSGQAIAASFVQDVDATGLLKNAIEFVVAYDPGANGRGLQTSTVTVDVNLVGGTDTFVRAIVANLLNDALEQLRATAEL